MCTCNVVWRVLHCTASNTMCMRHLSNLVDRCSQVYAESWDSVNYNFVYINIVYYLILYSCRERINVYIRVLGARRKISTSYIMVYIVNFCFFFTTLPGTKPHILLLHILLLILCNNKRTVGGRGTTITDRWGIRYNMKRPSKKVKADVAQQRCIIIYTYYRRYGIWGIRYIIIYCTIIKLCGSAAAVFACFVGSSATVYDDIKRKKTEKMYLDYATRVWKLRKDGF